MNLNLYEKKLKQKEKNSKIISVIVGMFIAIVFVALILLGGLCTAQLKSEISKDFCVNKTRCELPWKHKGESKARLSQKTAPPIF